MAFFSPPSQSINLSTVLPHSPYRTPTPHLHPSRSQYKALGNVVEVGDEVEGSATA